MPTEPFDLGRVKTTPLAGRPSLVRTDRFAGLPGPGATARELLRSLPDFLAGRGLRDLVAAIVAARRGGRGVVFGVGGHVVKTGCSPVVIDLMECGVITALAMPGSTAIHDFEIASAGQTSEDVAGRLSEGAYGTAEETGRFFAGAAAAGAGGAGLGRALGEPMRELPHAGLSLLATAARLDLPATVHVAVGTDTVHLHPAADGAALGAASHLDFRIFTTVVSRLAGGVYVNVGSAVMLPEVFLKAVTVAHNAGERLEGLFGANLDMLRHYRTRVNVVSRPVERGVDIAGHHEIMLPLLRLMVLGEMEEDRR
ncbi:MAG: hypothetical protein MUE73_07510 [Planctomycetes bacterium]|jgi:hypothetical protein|nr:hypothetical protein [Planctomycetota bacterium]